MAYTQPLYSHHEDNIARLDQAGDALIGKNDAVAMFEDSAEILSIVNNWRGAHYYPLNTFIQTLRNRAFAIDSLADVTSRIKRGPAIVAKLLDRPDMILSEMQDIGGCRAVFPSVGSVYDLVDTYRNASFRHILERWQDYITLPRQTGYRSYHLQSLE